MADFCYQCCRDILGVNPDENDLKGLSTEEDTIKELYPIVLCEGCGAIQVDHTGKCVSKNCSKKGHNESSSL
jgi:hypothetical protein